MAEPTIAVAGAAGDLGGRIVAALAADGIVPHALISPGTPEPARERLRRLGGRPIEADPRDRRALTQALRGAECVISALNGLRPVIIDRQQLLLEAAIQAGTSRFIPSDFSIDFTRTRPGANRNLDFRREFMARADQAPIRVTTILNGAFTDMLGAGMPLIQERLRRILFWRDADQPLDFTTKNDVAAYTAAVARDRDAPRILRIAGDTVSARDIARLMTDLTGQAFRTQSAGGIGTLGILIRVARLLDRDRTAPFPVWQGMQYMRDMFSGDGKLRPLDNRRYPRIAWTSVRQHLQQVLAARPSDGS